MPRLGTTPRDAVRTSKADMGKQEELVERALASGNKTMVNGIAFPADVAKRLLRNANVATNETFLVSCFVDLSLAPPPALTSQEPKEFHQRSPLKGKRTRTARVGFGFGGDALPEWEPLQQKSRPSSGGQHPSVAVQPLPQQLKMTPKGPYQVRLPVSCTVADAGVIIQNTLREIQQRERQAIQAAEEEHAKSMLYGHMLMSCDDIAQQRDAAVMKSIQRARDASGDNKSLVGPPIPAAGRRTSLFGQKQVPRGRRTSATPESLSLKSGGGSSGNSSPSPQQLCLTLRGAGHADLSSTTFNTQTLSAVRTVSADDVCGAHTIGISSLGALGIEIPRAGEVIDVLEAQQQQQQHDDSQRHNNSLSFTAFTAFDDPSHQSGSSSGRNASKLCGAISGIDYKPAFAERRFAIRPCDALGRVLSHANPHQRSVVTAGTQNDVDEPALCFAPPSKPLLQCFPKGTVGFTVCLAPDDAFHRARIQGLQADDAAQRHEAQERVCSHRADALEAMQATWNARDRRTLINSYERDEKLRAQLQRPTATESYKAFVKEEATEEYAKRKLRAAQEARATMEEMKRVAQDAFKQFLKGVYLLEADATTHVAALRALEQSSWSALVDAATKEVHAIAKAQRVAVAFHDVCASIDKRAVSASM